MIPLAVRSYFSLMYGTASPADLCRAARARGYSALGLADQDNLYGLWSFLPACVQEGIRPIIGARISDPAASGRAVTALVENDEGYRNLCRLISARHMAEGFQLIPALAAHARGLVFLAEDPDALRELHAAGAALYAALPGRLSDYATRVIGTARGLGVPVAAAAASVFLDPGDYPLHRLVRAIHGNTSLSRLRPEDLAPRHAYLAGPDEYQRRFETTPEALAATHELAERCAFTGPRLGTVLPPWVDPAGRTADEALREAAYAGARRRYGDDLSETVVERLEYELKIIASKNFSSYFLVVQNIVRRSPRICGRGSGAASLVAYTLGITNVCPIKHNLYFERFLNPGRTDPPDIDVDFAWDERDGVLNSVLEQYAGRAAMVCNHVCFQPRMAIRECAKVYGLTEREIEQVSRRLPWFWHEDDPEADLQTQLAHLPELKAVDFPEPWPEILLWAKKLLGAPRVISVHSGGMVITPGPFRDYAPRERAPKGVPIIQWEKDGTEDSGLVKIDLLGNRSLAVIRDALANVLANGIPFDEAKWEPEDDPATQAAVAAGRTMGCFYIESPAMRLLQQKTGVGDFEHLVIHSSIIRPAANEFIREYVRRLKGGAWEPIHPLLADVLDETFGIMVYQEDVSKSAVALAGFSHADADGLRKILTKKNRAPRLKDYQERFFAGARARGVAEKKIQAVWDMMMSFDGYSFCKPHSASYARVSFQAAYLKVHYPAEFMAAVISNQGGFYGAFAYVSEARRLGLAILPPDVNESAIRWRGRGRAIRVGLQSVRDLAAATQERLVAERERGPFLGIGDFLARVAPSLDEGRALVYAGACDGLLPGGNRAELLWSLSAGRPPRSALSRAASSLALLLPGAEPAAPPIPPERAIERLRQEYHNLGFLCDRHPMTLYARALEGRNVVKAKDISRHVGRRVLVAGWLITGKVVYTKHDDPMEFVTFEDETGLMETTFFPEAYARFCDRLAHNHPFLLSAKVEEEFGVATLVVDRAEPLGNMPDQRATTESRGGGARPSRF